MQEVASVFNRQGLRHLRNSKWRIFRKPVLENRRLKTEFALFRVEFRLWLVTRVIRLRNSKEELPMLILSLQLAFTTLANP